MCSCAHALIFQHRYSSMLLKQTMFVPLEEISRRRKRMYGFLLSSTQNLQRMSSSPASPEEIDIPRPPVHRHANDSITSKCNARWEAEVGIMQSIFSRSHLQVHRTSRCKLQTQQMRQPPPSSLKKTNNRKRHIRPVICTSSSCLPSFQPSL